MRVIKLDPKRRRPSAAEIFTGDVETSTVFGGEESHDLTLSEIHFKNGARNRWHIHSTDQILICTEGEGIVATADEQRDLEAGIAALIPANTRHRHGAKPGKNMTHLSVLGPADTRVVD